MVNTRRRILIVEDSPPDLENIRDLVEAQGHLALCTDRLETAQSMMNDDPRIDIVISDVQLPDGDGANLIPESGAHPPVILVTAYGGVESAVQAMRRGALHYLVKPVRQEELEVILSRAAVSIETSRELSRLRELEGLAMIEDEMVVRAPAMREIMEMARAAAATDATILLLGASGTGKEVVAKAVHRLSPRARGPFVAVHCGAIPATLLEADLFGHERGAFTGATARRVGKFERAHGGTLFLDEIGTMPVELQSRLLRVIQEREVERVGGDRPIRVDIRLIAATNRDLARAVAAGEFREDLFYRLNVVPLHLPPLCERSEEIPALIARILDRHGRAEVSIDPAAMDRLMSYSWPGNVRELENVIERSLILAGGASILARHLPPEIRGGQERRSQISSGMSLETAKRVAIESALRGSGGRRDEAARVLGVHRNTLNRLVKRYGIQLGTDAG
jgi:two-component system, NtrC family, response regulator HydG